LISGKMDSNNPCIIKKISSLYADVPI